MAKDKNKKLPLNVLSKKGLMGLTLAGVMMASPFMLAGCSNGQNGKDGTPGTVWKSGTSYTEFTDAKVGDYYIDTDDFILYQKSETDWTIVMENYGKPGATASDIEMRVSSGQIQWRYKTGVDTTWKNLLSVSTLTGANGYTPYIKDGYWYINGVNQNVKASADNGKEIELQKGADSIQWRYEGDAEWTDLVSLSLLKGENGTNGKSVKIAVNEGNIQWRYTDDSNDWQTIIAVETLKGTNGIDGKTPHIDETTGNWFIGTQDTGYKASGVDGKQIKLQVTADHIQWQYEGDSEWNNLIPLSSLKGVDGTTWISGSVVPTTEGKDGDFYLNENTYDIYKKTDGVWAKIGNIKGSDGIDGAGAEITLPSYWKTYLDEKIAEINAKSESYGSNADAFIFITDQHLDGSVDYAAQIINYIAKNTSIKKVVFGGDTVADGVDGNAILREYVESFSDDLTVLGMRGNHDPKANITENSFYDIMIRPLIDKAEVTNELYYCYDNNAQKIRYIITDSVASKTNNLTSEKQLKWMQEKILELESDWTTVIVHHGIWEGTSANTQTLTRSADGQRLIDAIDAVYDKAQCTIAGVYSGHSHRDYYELSAKGYALVSTSTDCENSTHSVADINYPTRTPGTTTEQTFDVVFINTTTHKFETIRIGAGEDKTLGYETNIDLSGTQTDITSEFFNEEADNRGWFAGAIQWQTGEFDDTSGTNAKDWLSSDYVDISEYDSLTFSHAQVKNAATTNGYAFYDENKQYIMGYSNASGVGAARVQKVKVQIPENAKYVRIMWMSEGHVNYDATVYNISNFYCYGNKLSDSAIELTNQFNDWTPGAILHATGLFNTTDESVIDDWEYSNLVDISAYDSIAFSHIQVGNTETPNGFAFYGEDGETLISGHTNGTGTAGIARVEMEVPEGAKYIRIMWMKPGHSKYTEEEYGKANLYFYGIIDVESTQE